ncbi:MAG: type I methionyl aminopeptidase [Candidatus Levybacteria bacterium RIFCSPLOWO2_01_FULL_36_13]|nr:MAG: type I methionyl aminopeptidase [Candidatus Levybacteria bacterium RIFCSPHIGHO2_01_FULL_36_15b]OGH35033.1 MAG: type I methionyl aminopeptidase [Candidatus Levybacteria bacterium RIFCSPLOWO2_01_FULL_36_13]
MLDTKTKQKINAMKQGGAILSFVMKKLIDAAKPGISEINLDSLAEKIIKEKGGESGFKKVDGYKFTICVSLNDVCAHGIPTSNKLKEGDVLGIDCGVYFKGFHTDMSETIRVTGSKPKTQKDDKDKFIEIGKKVLIEALKQAKEGKHIGDISNTIQSLVEVQNGYSVVRSLVGHGVGKKLHEKPEVPGYLKGSIKDTPRLYEGMTIAIEVIYNMGKPELVLDKDGWSLKTKDGSTSGLFERSVAITKQGPLILTP